MKYWQLGHYVSEAREVPLIEFRGLTMRDYALLQTELESRSVELKHRLQKIINDVTRSHSSGWSEQAQERENDEVLNQLGHEAEREIQEIDAALNRLKNDSYGCCLECDKPLPMPRLKIKPEATHCTYCAYNA